MPKFTLIAEHKGAHKITHEFDEEFLPDVLDNIELFLRGAGFCSNGVLEFVEEEIYTFDQETYPDMFGYHDVEQPVDLTNSSYYFDTDRNK